MPIHDWTRVSAGTFHSFDLHWIGKIQESLNAGLLPDGYYALAEQISIDYVPDVLTLERFDSPKGSVGKKPGGRVAALEEPPRVSVVETVDEAATLATRQRHVAIKHSNGDRTVAMIEIVSPGNKSGRRAVDKFVDKAVNSLNQGLHLVLADVLPPTPTIPAGMHAEIWSAIGGRDYRPDPKKPLTPVAYRSTAPTTCYLEPTAVGLSIADLPLFLDSTQYVNAPLDSTYNAAYLSGVPKRWRDVIEGAAN